MDHPSLSALSRRLHERPRLLIGNGRRRRAAAALVDDGGCEAINAVLAALATWSGAERDWLLKEIAACASPEGHAAVCEYFFRHGDPDLGAMLLAWAYVPKKAAGQALLCFLTGQWQRYEDLDLDHSLLRAAYEAADPPLRRRLMEQ